MSDEKTRLRRSGQAGFTLVEIVMTMVLVSILAAIAAVIILQGVRGYVGEEARSNVHYQARNAVERMARELRLVRWNQTTASADVTAMTATDFEYTDIQGNKMGFRLNAGALQRTQDGATWQTLATGATALNFTYLQQDRVTAATAATLWFVVINLTDTQGSESLSLRTWVHPRSF